MSVLSVSIRNYTIKLLLARKHETHGNEHPTPLTGSFNTLQTWLSFNK